MTELHARLDLPLDNYGAPAAARHTVASMLKAWGFDDQGWLDAAQVVVSELVTNAVVHGGGSVEVALHLHDQIVTLTVADGSSVAPRPRLPDEAGGRGLLLMGYLTTAWGVRDHQGGKQVWAQLLPPPSTSTGHIASAGQESA